MVVRVVVVRVTAMVRGRALDPHRHLIRRRLMQTQIRASNASDFPDVERFRQRKRDEAFNSPRHVADEFLAIAFDPASRPREVAIQVAFDGQSTGPSRDGA